MSEKANDRIRISTDQRTLLTSDAHKLKMGYLGQAGSSVLQSPGNKRRRDVWASRFMSKSKESKRRIIREPWVYSVASMNLAAVQIQRVVRSYISRVAGYLPQKSHTADDKGRRWCDMGLGEKSDVYIVNPLYHVACMQIQLTWRSYCRNRYTQMVRVTPEAQAATRVQRVWRGYTNSRIYKYYKDLISFRTCGDPSELLKCINPREASLIEPSMGAYVRFRLGGATFPPSIYYKIYSRSPLCDVGAFAPKDYSRSRQCDVYGRRFEEMGRGGNDAAAEFEESSTIRVGHSSFSASMSAATMEELRSECGTSGWYARIENNGWRSVALQTLKEIEEDPVTKATNDLAVRFHYSKVKRRKDKVAARKRKKLAWMRRMYGIGANEEKKEADEENGDEDEEELLSWSSSLDFDAYIDDWQRIGTSENSTRTFTAAEQKYN